MKLPSPSIGPSSSSSKGKEKVQYIESSDEDDDGRKSSSDDDEYWLNECEADGGREALDYYAFLDQLEEDGEREMNEDTNVTGILEENEKEMKSKKNTTPKPVLKWKLLEQEIRRWVSENLDKDTDLTNLNETVTEIVEPTDDLIIPLLRFQKEWLAWAVKQEQSSFRGGILADEMGMGKTLQAIALVLFKRKNPCNMSFGSHEQKLRPIGGTLVICPPVAVMQWVQEIERSTSKGSVEVLVYHGRKRAEKLHQLSECDFLVTTYEIVMAEHSKSQMPLKENYKSILHSVMWDRIILDEAHYIKGKKNKRTRAVLALQSRYKWALSGTPVQNSVAELYSLVRFLRIIPYSRYFCKDCDCHVLDRALKQCPDCGHHQYRHFRWWHKYVAKPIQNGETKDWSCRQSMILLKHGIMKNIMLRRTKEDRAADLALPPKIEILRLDSLDTVEEGYYITLLNMILKKVKKDIEEWTVSNDHSHTLDLITRMRQAVNHPYLVEHSRNPESCRICGTNEDTSAISCGHFFCQPCLIERDTENSSTSCLNTFAVDFEEQNSKPLSILSSIKLDQFRTSSKIDALKEEIRFMVEMDGSAKGIVFSHFSSFLDLVHYALHKSGVNSILFYGLMTLVARDAAITRFREDPNCRIFLTTFKTGGVALNLPVASHVFLMEPWYNPTVEWQAQDRVHRIGQLKPVRVVRFIMKNTVEERILEFQKNKELLFQGTVGGSSEVQDKLEKMDRDDIWRLFYS